jgi:repressor LexA
MYLWKNIARNGLAVEQDCQIGVDTGRKICSDEQPMKGLTRRQQQVLDYISDCQQRRGLTPTLREIAHHFGFRSMTASADHVRALRNKGALNTKPRRARFLQVKTPCSGLRQRVMDIPIYGSIPAGLAENRQQEPDGCLTIDVGSLGFKPTPRTFALEVRGDSMIGRHIISGDLVVLEHGVTPKNGDVVAALIDNESTLKTLVMERGRTWLRAENPKYPKLIPAGELVIQGVMVALIRKGKR